MKEEWIGTLVCPITREPLRYDPARQSLIADQAGIAYPIVEGVPVLIASAARKIDAPDDQASSP